MFFAKEIEYVGSAINENGIHLNPRKINEINELPEPKDLSSYKDFYEGLIIIQSLFPSIV